jgi:hypothetical protein
MKIFSIISAVIVLAMGASWLAGCTSPAASSNANTPAAAENTIAPVATDAAKAFSIEFNSEPGEIQAGQPATLAFTVKDKQGAVVKDLAIVHEKPMHVLVVSADLAEFYHIHPEQKQSDGSYRVEHTFPNGGAYRIYTDFTPKDAVQVVEQIDVRVAGQERPKQPLVADTNFEKSVDGLKVVMTPDSTVEAGKELMLNFQAFDAVTNKPATDLQNYLGELAHFVLISEDMKDFVHAHPMSKGEMDGTKKGDGHAADGHEHSTMEGTTTKPSASEVAAHTSFPRSGLYKVWAQFQRGGRVITVPFVVSVKEGETKRAEAPENVEFPADAKKVIVTKEGFEPGTVSFSKGDPMRIAFYRADSENCASEVVFKGANLTKKLPVGKVVTIDIPNMQGKEISFACGMDMYKGKVVIQ